MTAIELVLTGVLCALVYAGMSWLIARCAGINEMADESDDERAQQIIAASRPAPLDHPRVRAGTAWGQDLQP